MSKKRGAEGFSDEYWKTNYETPEEMDGIANAKDHALYIKSLFDMDYVPVRSVIDFGFGLGFLLEAILKELKPYKALGIEPSSYAFNNFLERSARFDLKTKLKLKQQDLVSWAEQSSENSKHYDLGICTSVFQYLSNAEINQVIPIMAQRCRYLYFSVPTDIELERQVSELKFKDEYAIRRSRQSYLRLLRPHFTIISSRLLESKVHFDETNSRFTDLLFRF